MSDRVQDDGQSTELRPFPIDRPETMVSLTPDVPALGRVELNKFAHPFQKGSRIRIWIDTPKRMGRIWLCTGVAAVRQQDLARCFSSFPAGPWNCRWAAGARRAAGLRHDPEATMPPRPARIERPVKHTHGSVPLPADAPVAARTLTSDDFYGGAGAAWPVGRMSTYSFLKCWFC
jgi:hypothetical protein